MGFEAPRTIFNLKFVDEEMEGLQIRACSPSMGEFFEVSKLADFADQDIKPEDLPKLMPVFELFINSIKSWNLENDGVPVPITVAGLFKQDHPFIFKIIDAWMNAVASVPGPLVKPSQDGVQFPVALTIPMEPLLENQAS